MNAQFSFNTQGVPPRESSYEVIPAGWCLMQVVESGIEDLKSGKGQCLKLVFEVIQKPFAGRKIFTRLNVRHTSAEAERIAQQDLRELCEAVGLPNGFQNSFQLHNRPFSGRVKIRPAEGNYEAQNEVRGYKPANAATPNASSATMPSTNSAPPPNTNAAPPPAPQSAPAARSGNAPPWQR